MSVLKVILRLGIGIALVALLLWKHGVDLNQVLERAWNMPLYFLLGALVVDLAGKSLSAYRWVRVTRQAGYDVSFRHALPIFYSGMFFNTCLPTSIGGDVMRVVGMSRLTRSKSAAFASVFMDRNIGMAALLTVGLVSALCTLTMEFPASIQATLFKCQFELSLWPVFLLFILGFTLANLILFRDQTYNLVERLVLNRLPAKLRAKVDKLHSALKAYKKPIPQYWAVYLIALVYQVSEVFMVWLLGNGLGLHLPFWIFGAMVTFQAVMGLIPISIGNLGVREAIFCAVMIGQAALVPNLVGEDLREAALALGLIYYGVTVVTGIVGGFVYLVAGLPKPTAEELAEISGADEAPGVPKALPKDAPVAPRA